MQTGNATMERSAVLTERLSQSRGFSSTYGGTEELNGTAGFDAMGDEAYAPEPEL